MIRLLRIPLVLAFATLWAAGSYALGYLILPDRLTFALGGAFVGGVVSAVVMGGLTGRSWPILLGIPLAIGAMTTSVYVASIHYLESKPRQQVVVASSECVHEHKLRRGSGTACDRWRYALKDASGKVLSYQLDSEDEQGTFQQDGKTLDVYLRDTDTLKIWPVSVVEPKQNVRTAANITVPLFAGYVIVLGIAGAVSRLASRRRVRDASS